MNIVKGLVLTFIIILSSDNSSTFPIDNNLKFSTDTTDLTADSKSSLPELPPLLFPEDPKAYNIVPPNNTALKILQHIKDTTIPTPQLQKVVTNSRGVSIFRVSNNMYVDDIPEEFPSDFAENLKGQVEEIQPNDFSKPTVELEERFHEQPANLRAHDIFAEDIETHTPKLSEGHITAILAGVLAVICLGAFIGLISWRSYIERRYGKRERLVNQDDYYRNNDTRHIDL